MEISILCYRSNETKTYQNVIDTGPRCDHYYIANRFCQYFANVSPNLASKITQVSKSFSEYLTRVTSSSLQNFDPVQMNEFD